MIFLDISARFIWRNRPNEALVDGPTQSGWARLMQLSPLPSKRIWLLRQTTTGGASSQRMKEKARGITDMSKKLKDRLRDLML